MFTGWKQQSSTTYNAAELHRPNFAMAAIANGVRLRERLDKYDHRTF